MRQVLAGRDFRNLETSTARDTLLEKLANGSTVYGKTPQVPGARGWWGA